MARNTLLFTAFLAVLAALLVGFNIGRKLKPTQPAATPSPSPTPAIARASFVSDCGISFDYPATLEKLDGASGSAVFTDPANEANSIAVTCQADIPRPPITPERIETVMLTSTAGATFSALLYHDASQKDGTPIDELIFTHPETGLDVFVAGFGTIFQQILSTLKVL